LNPPVKINDNAIDTHILCVVYNELQLQWIVGKLIVYCISFKEMRFSSLFSNPLLFVCCEFFNRIALFEFFSKWFYPFFFQIRFKTFRIVW